MTLTTNPPPNTDVSGDQIAARTLLLIWKSGDSLFEKVGELRVLPEGRYQFSYTDRASELVGFQPLPEFPNLGERYEQSTLPAFFENRILNSQRASYGDYLDLLGLDRDQPDLPIEVLVRSGGARATDTFHVVEKPPLSRDVLSDFFVSGLRHIDEHGVVLAEVNEGDRLALRQDFDNEVNERAVLIDVDLDKPIGFVPNWLLPELYDWLGGDLSGGVAVVAQVNRGPEVPWHLKMRCRILRAD